MLNEINKNDDELTITQCCVTELGIKRLKQTKQDELNKQK